MRFDRPVLAADPRLFGRRLISRPEQAALAPVASDLRLFAATFAGGFLFVSILIA